MDLEDDTFVRFVVAAAHGQLDYILIGGLALILNGGIRYTEDADVWMEPTNENRDRLINVLRKLDFTDDELAILASVDFTQPQVIRLEDQIDILTRVHVRLNYNECRKRAKPFIMPGGQVIYFLHINDLRESKVLARRTKDLNDVLMIDEIINETKENSSSEKNEF
ncbi:hypothetical protein M0L20_16040 [Spirosoma sp. RP8]|uniref:DUF6036 domain-containing protein n=1 Tax=Spirosoma liriopis TaxID=2937440 RepID=A0ABT0HMI0_9BACT|nr:DUF6036 family nucleotidyltransferase [Spirosoma liriopis]MCK8493379.1 hypothetical protein [Spirosoma liriopis]